MDYVEKYVPYVLAFSGLHSPMPHSVRILAACLKYFAKCPCPLCLVEKGYLADMGKLVDYHRHRKVRIDNLDVQFRIKVARGWLFEKGLSLNSVYFKRTLDPLSLTPTRVSLVSRITATLGT